MKRNVFIALLVTVTLIISGCFLFSNQDGSSDDPDDPSNPSGGQIKYTREFLGEWIRMDTGERWYISESSITVNGAAFDRTVTLVKSSAQVITVSEADRADYILFASRIADASFKAQVVMLDENGTGRSISRAAILSGGFKIKPPNNPGQEQVVYPDPETGDVTVEGIIPGDPVEIIPVDDEWKDVNVAVTPWDEQNMGIIPLAKGANHKVSIEFADTGIDTNMLYADGTPQRFIIKLKNIGNADSTGPSYRITWDEEDFILNAGTVQGVLDTIVPGGTREIPLTLGSKPIENGYKNKEVKVTIGYYDTETFSFKYWNDTVSVTYYKTRIPFRIKSRRPVQGVVKVPRGRELYYFKTSGPEGNCTFSMDVPWSSEDYLVGFMGASAETNSETHYSLAINDQPPGNWDSLLFEDMYINEPNNNSETGATVLDMEENSTFMGYLHNGDIDWYRINLGDVAPDPIIVDMEEWEIDDQAGGYWDGRANPGDTINIDVKLKNYSQDSRIITMTGLAAESAYAQYVQNISLPYYPRTLPPGHYGSLTSYTTNPVSGMVPMFDGSSYIDNTFSFKLAPDCPPGTITFSLSFQDNFNIGYLKTIRLNVEVPPINITLDGVEGNLIPGETSVLTVRAKNTGTRDANGVSARLRNPGGIYGGFITSTGGSVMGTLTAGGPSASANLSVSLSPSCPAGVQIPLRVEFANSEGNTWNADFSVYALPPGPANVEAEPLSENSVRVSWDQVAGATEYNVYNDDGALLSVLSGSTQYEHTGLSDGTVYSYRVSALVGGDESAKSAVATARTWERLMFNRQYNVSVSANVPHYYRFNVTNSASYRCTSGVSVPVRYENGDANWFTLNSGTENQTASQSGWAYFRLSAAGSYSFKISTSEAAVSSFIFPSLSTVISGPGLNETEKTVTFKVPFGTNLDGITPSIVAAYGWTQVTGGTQNFSAPVEYIFTNGAVLQAYTVTITPDGQGGVVVNPPPSGSDETILGLPASGFIVSRSGSGGPPSLSVTLSGTGYSSIDWWVDETYKSGEAANNGRTFVVQASAYTIGKHTLTVVVYKDNVPYSNDVDFTVTQ